MEPLAGIRSGIQTGSIPSLFLDSGLRRNDGRQYPQSNL